MTQHDAQLPDRNGDVLDGVRAALARPGDLSDHDAEFYRRLVDAVDQLIVDRDQARRDASIAGDVTAQTKRLLERRTGTLRARAERAESDRDRLRTAWTSARRGRAQATAGVDYLLKEVETAMAAVEKVTAERDRARRTRDRYRDERNAAWERVDTLRLAYQAAKDSRPDLADHLPPEDLVEPGDEVPTLAEMDGRVHTLEAGAASVEQLRKVVDRVAAIEERLNPAPVGPTRWRDRDGHIWVEHGYGFRRQDTDDRVPNMLFLGGLHGPLTLVTDAPAGGTE